MKIFSFELGEETVVHTDEMYTGDYTAHQFFPVVEEFNTLWLFYRSSQANISLIL